jgi:branched-chain amino acid transport system ATP-binding protein
MSLSLQNLRAGYGTTTVLRDVTIEVPAASVVALVGPNGAGKTTLMKAAAGLIPLAAGRVLLDGEDLTGAAPERRAAAGMILVPEGRGIYPSLTVRENLRLQARRGDEREAIERATDAFPRLGERLGQRAGTMSGGEQQMLALARTYLRRPRVALLDEVSFGLAPVVLDEVFAFLGRLAAEETALLLVEQYIDRALALADTVHVLGRGEIRFSGSPDDLRAADVGDEYFALSTH